MMKPSPFLIVTMAFTILITGCWGPSKQDASNIAISKIEEFRKVKKRLPDSLSEAGAQDDESCPCYCKTGADSYLVWYGTTLGESDTYDSETRKWSSGNRACVAGVTQRMAEPSGPIISPANDQKENCACTEHLRESQMGRQVEHIEMAADVTGNHVNINGIALMEVTVDRDGQVLCVQTLSGHPLAITHLIGASRSWKFKPYLKNGSAQRFCGRLRVNFSFVENKPSVEVAIRENESQKRDSR